MDVVTAAGHTIVCGLHDVGLRIVEQLYLAGEQVVVVDDTPDPRSVRVIAEWPVQHLTVSAQREASLVAAGLADARALICTDSDDLRNLETALLARRLRPELRIVVQLTNLTVGRAVSRVTGAGAVLDVATLAASSFADACLARRSHQLDLDGHEFRTLELTVERGGSLRHIYGDLVPIAVMRADGSPIEICPGRDVEVQVGDRVMVLSTDDDLGDRGLEAPPVERRARAARPGHVRAAWRLLTSFLGDTDGPIRLALTALLILAVASSVLIYVWYRTSSHRSISVLDAVYFTTETLTTVGFGDFTFGAESPWLVAWAIVLMVLGAGLVATFYALLTNLLVSRNVDRMMGRHLIKGIRGHIVIVGLGSVGMRVLEQLVADGYEVVVLDRDEHNRYLSSARALDVPVFIGDSTDARVLAAVNLGTASAVAVLTSSDLVNIETGLAVDELLGGRREHVPVVMRVFDRELAATIEAAFGFRDVRSTSALAAPWFVGAALGLDVLATFYADREPLLLGRLTIAPDGGLNGQTMRDLSAAVRVIAIRRSGQPAELEYPPRRDTRFAGGDQAYVVGPYEELLGVLRREQRVPQEPGSSGRRAHSAAARRRRPGAPRHARAAVHAKSSSSTRRRARRAPTNTARRRVAARWRGRPSGTG